MVVGLCLHELRAQTASLVDPTFKVDATVIRFGLDASALHLALDGSLLGVTSSNTVVKLTLNGARVRSYSVDVGRIEDFGELADGTLVASSYTPDPVLNRGRVRLYSTNSESPVVVTIDPHLRPRILPLPDGRFILYGTAAWPDHVPSYTRCYIDRRLPNGEHDPEFTLNLRNRSDFGSSGSGLQQVFLCPDGDLILVGGFDCTRNFSPPATSFEATVARLRPDGTVKWFTNTFGVSTSWEQAYGIGPKGEVYTKSLLRVDPEGRVDSRFQVPCRGSPINISSGAVDSQGRLVLAGAFTTICGLPRSGLAKFQEDGTVDPYWDPGSGPSPSEGGTFLLALPDARILCQGQFFQFDGIDVPRLARLLPQNPDVAGRRLNAYVLEVGPNGLYPESCYSGVTLKVRRSGDLGRSGRVRLHTVSATAVAGRDFEPLDQVLEFVAGQSTVSVTIVPLSYPDSRPGRFGLHLQSVEPDSVVPPDPFWGNCSTPSACSDSVVKQLSVPEGGSASVEISFPGTLPIPASFLGLRVKDPAGVLSHGGAVSVNQQFRVVPPRWTVFVQNAENEWFDGIRSVALEFFDSRTGETLLGASPIPIHLWDDDNAAGASLGLDGMISYSGYGPDGSAIHLGTFSHWNGVPAPGFVRLDPAGNVLPGVPPMDEKSMRGIEGALPLSEGKSLVWGYNYGLLQGHPYRLVRLLSSGALDPTFQHQGAATGGTTCSGVAPIGPVVRARDGSIWFVIRDADPANCTKSIQSLRHVDADGAVISSVRLSQASQTVFGPADLVPDPYSGGVLLVQEDQVERISAEGTRSLLTQGTRVDFALALTNGMVLVAEGSRLHRISSTGVHDWTELNAGAPTRVLSAVELPGGQVLMVGSFSGRVTFLLDPSGSVQEWTQRALPTWVTSIDSMHLGSDGEIIAIASASSEKSISIRLYPWGAPVADAAISRVVPMADGSVAMAVRGQAFDGYTIEASRNLQDWAPLYHTTDPFDTGLFTDVPATGTRDSVRFYRIRR